MEWEIKIAMYIQMQTQAKTTLNSAMPSIIQ